MQIHVEAKGMDNQGEETSDTNGMTARKMRLGPCMMPKLCWGLELIGNFENGALESLLLRAWPMSDSGLEDGEWEAFDMSMPKPILAKEMQHYGQVPRSPNHSPTQIYNA